MSASHTARKHSPARSVPVPTIMRHGGTYVVPYNSLMGSQGFKTEPQDIVDAPYAPPEPPNMYGTSQTEHVAYDESSFPYIVRSDSDPGEWHRYINQNGYEEVSFWPHQSNNFNSQNLENGYGMVRAHVHGQSPVLRPSGQSSARDTPRETPDPDMANVEFHMAPTSKRKRVTRLKDRPRWSALEQPLSELTKHLTHVPVKDMDAWVNRSTEERQKEKRPDGSIKRPSNSFMLYRSAYTDRCRELEKSKNHQDISSLAGASWAIETPDVKIQFEEWAKTERENHQKTFPDYKFQPQSQAAKDRKRKQRNDDASEEVSDRDDTSYRGSRGNSKGRSKSTRSKVPRALYREYSDSPSFPSSDEVDTPEPFLPIENHPSYFPSLTPGKPLPTAVDRISQQGGYYITSYPNAANGSSLALFDSPRSVDDLGYYPDDSRSMEYPSCSPPSGLPGASHDSLIGEMAVGAEQTMLPGQHLLDPSIESTGQEIEELSKAVDSTLAPPSARSLGFHASDYLGEGEGAHFFNDFGHDTGFGG